jgi:hypothetical protein
MPGLAPGIHVFASIYFPSIASLFQHCFIAPSRALFVP